MFLSGIKFGVGFCLGISAFMGLLMASICLSSWISRLLEARKRSPYREERAPKGMEWKGTSTSAPRDHGTIPSFSFCSVIRWENREDRKKSQHRDGVR